MTDENIELYEEEATPILDAIIAELRQALADCRKVNAGYTGQMIQPACVPVEEDDLRLVLDSLAGSISERETLTADRDAFRELAERRCARVRELEAERNLLQAVADSQSESLDGVMADRNSAQASLAEANAELARRFERIGELKARLAEARAAVARLTTEQQLSKSRAAQAIQDIEALPSMRLVNIDNREVISRDEAIRIARGVT